MGDRVSRLEGALDWVKVTIAVTTAVAIGGVAFIGAQLVRVDGRVSALSDKVSILSEKVDALPERVSANLRDLTNTLAQAILASKQTPPQVVLLPAPQIPAPQQPAPRP